MIKAKIDHIRNGVYEDTGLFIVDTDNNNRKPKYPFYSYKITTLQLDNNQEGAVHIEFVNDTANETMQLDSKMILSLNAYSDTADEAYSKALRLWEYFKFRGKLYLYNGNIAVVNISDIQDRTIYIADKFEYRYGFDVNLRVLHDIEREVGVIETYTIDKIKEE